MLLPSASAPVEHVQDEDNGGGNTRTSSASSGSSTSAVPTPSPLNTTIMVPSTSNQRTRNDDGSVQHKQPPPVDMPEEQDLKQAHDHDASILDDENVKLEKAESGLELDADDDADADVDPVIAASVMKSHQRVKRPTNEHYTKAKKQAQLQ